MNINVDFDETLTTGEGPPHWKDGSYEVPNEDMVDWVNHQFYAGNTVIIWTARPWSQAGNVAGYLTQWGVHWHGMRCDKGGADMYVDDRARHPDDVLSLPRTENE